MEKKASMLVHEIDESGFHLSPGVVKTYAPRGQWAPTKLESAKAATRGAGSFIKTRSSDVP
jgi:hypothetical protein